MSLQTCLGSPIKCSHGSIPMVLVPTPKPVMTNGRVAANIMDHIPIVNIPPFGMCNCPSNPMVAAATAAALGVLTPMPCIPVTPAPWLIGTPTVLVAGAPALDDGSMLLCVWTGEIEFIAAGQVNHEIP
ncbi:MAG: hypothetical protein JWQ11_1368 [Rhizobacter sp.]|nr:hypothetical protein [Rhizobacter sp.]